MSEELSNVYADTERAESYARLEFPGTYLLAYRDIPRLLEKHVTGTRAIDFGCGTGRSTRFLKSHGYDAVGVDIAADMVQHAKQLDKDGRYLVIGDGDLCSIDDESFDVVLSVFTFDNIIGDDKKTDILRSLRRKLRPGGKIVSLVSTPEIYVNEWASFTTGEFTENKGAKHGDTVRIVMTDVEDARPIVDTVCTDAAYRRIFESVQLTVLEAHRPLGTAEDGIEWKNELTIPPWCIYVLGR